MHPILRAAPTTLSVIVLTWPLLFWKAGVAELHEPFPGTGQPLIYNDMVRPDLPGDVAEPIVFRDRHATTSSLRTRHEPGSCQFQ